MGVSAEHYLIIPAHTFGQDSVRGSRDITLPHSASFYSPRQSIASSYLTVTAARPANGVHCDQWSAADETPTQLRLLPPRWQVTPGILVKSVLLDINGFL